MSTSADVPPGDVISDEDFFGPDHILTVYIWWNLYVRLKTAHKWHNQLEIGELVDLIASTARAAHDYFSSYNQIGRFNKGIGDEPEEIYVSWSQMLDSIPCWTEQYPPRRTRIAEPWVLEVSGLSGVKCQFHITGVTYSSIETVADGGNLSGAFNDLLGFGLYILEQQRQGDQFRTRAPGSWSATSL